jgi:hypothetical protein
MHGQDAHQSKKREEEEDKEEETIKGNKGVALTTHIIERLHDPRDRRDRRNGRRLPGTRTRARTRRSFFSGIVVDGRRRGSSGE